MEDKSYDWRRLWCPRAEYYQLAANGYLAAGDDPGASLNSHLRSTDSLIDVPCLVLLGEPGIGKSTESKRLHEITKVQVAETTAQILSVDLRSIGTEQRLSQKIFESDTFRSWLKGSHRLYLFLDSLDECLLRVATIASIFADELPEFPIDRLMLRIACRTAVWPSLLENTLRQLWGKDSFGICELAVLQRQDVTTAARRNGIEAEAFLREIQNARVASFANKPVTLEFLLKSYLRNSALPDSQRTLYQQGCRILCEETNQSRQASLDTRKMSADQRMAIAARIAALTVFGGKYAIGTMVDTGSLPDEVLPLRTLCGGPEPASDQTIQVTEAAVREALDTGLFTSRGTDMIGWAHQTYAEFLAAYWTQTNDLEPRQIRSLIQHPSDPDRRLAPQLYETAAWIATQQPEILNAIMVEEANVLLRSDVATLDPSTLARIVTQLLVLIESGKLFHRDLPGADYLRKLQHAGLVEQLRPYISDRTKSQETRWTAIGIAVACQLTPLQETLAEIALDAEEPYYVRVQAASAVSRIGDRDCRCRLLPLAITTEEDDPDDELRGCSLRALWPECITPGQLFDFLTRPYHPGLLGAYRAFAEYELLNKLQSQDLPIALEWVARQDSDVMSLHPFTTLIGAILRQAWEHLDAPETFAGVVAVALRRLDDFEAVHPAGVSADDRQDDAKRRRLAAALIGACKRDDRKITALTSLTPHLLLPRDCPWLLEQAASAETEDLQTMFARVLRYSYYWQVQECFDALCEVAQSQRSLQNEFALILDPVKLGSEQALLMKQEYERQVQWQSRRQRPVLTPPPSERIQLRLDELERGNLDAWVTLNLDLQLEPDSAVSDKYHEADLIAQPGWQAADANTRERILAAAKRYVVEKDSSQSIWLGTDSIPHTAMAGYRALRLLLEEQEDKAENLPPEIWAKWAPITIVFPIANHGEAYSRFQAHLSVAYRHAPQEILDALKILIYADNVKHGNIWILERMRLCWDERLGQTLASMLADSTLTPSSLNALLAALLSHRAEAPRSSSEAESAAKDILAAYLDGAKISRERALVAAYNLLMYAIASGWPLIWIALQKDAVFARHHSGP